MNARILLPRFALALCVLTSLLAPRVARAQLRSPWDGLSIAATDAPYTCPEPPPFEKTINAESYYIDAHHSIIDPVKKAAEEKATEAPTHLGQWSGEAADAWLTKGSRAAATCVYSLLDAAARAHAWSGEMPTGQGHYEQKWLLAGVSVAYLKVRNSGVGTPDQQKNIQKWFSSVADRVTDYVDTKKVNPDSDAWNNHRYWAGLAVAAAGIAADKKSDFAFGVLSYKVGITFTRSRPSS